MGLSPAGSYFVGAAADFDLTDEHPGRILVQPNFDVVFLSPSSRAEMEISRFSERKGRGVGCLLGSQSLHPDGRCGWLHAQARTGYSAGALHYRTTREHGAQDHCMVPAISPDQFRETTLIHCPDAETARILAVAGRKAVKLNDTILEWTEGKVPASLVKKLREMGIFSGLARESQ